MTRRRGFWPIVATLAFGLLAAVSATASVPRAEVATGGAVPARTIRVMTWNACAGNNTGCRFYGDPTGPVTAVRQYMRGHGAPADAALIQEFCASFAAPLERELERHYGYGWDVRFAPIKIKQPGDPAAAPAEQCVRGRGAYGIALAVPDENTWWQTRYLPSAEGAEWRVALCATVESWWVKLCNAHLSYGGDDPTGAFRAQQVPAYLGFVEPTPLRVVFGGDLNLPPHSPRLAPVYDSYVECAQADPAAPRAGPGTSYTSTPHDNAHTVKIDYLFTNPGLAHTCGTVAEVVEVSDHRPLWITISLPATMPI
jgi:endonuclease/exonuclease/phosphatase family metal-dependent hydrolase